VPPSLRNIYIKMHLFEEINWKINQNFSVGPKTDSITFEAWERRGIDRKVVCKGICDQINIQS